MATVYPVLHHQDAIDAKTIASHFLVDTDADTPVVAYLKDDGSQPPTYITWKSLKRSRKPGLGHLKTKALTDLTHRPARPGWTPRSVVIRGQNAIVLERVGDFLTASDIMDEEILGIAHHYFKSDAIYIGIPHACYMVAALDPAHVSQTFLRAYDEAVAEDVQFYETVYKVENEILTEICPIQELPIGPEMRRVNDDHVLWYTIPYRGDFNLLTHYIINDLPELIPKYLKTDGFAGRIVVEIPEPCPKFTLGQCQKLSELEVSLNTIARDEGWLTSELSCAVIRILFPQRRKAVRGLSDDALSLLKNR